MVLPIVKYGTPILRKKGARVEAITPDVRQLVADMLETMYAQKGVGLAAQQVGRALQITVIDVRGVTDRPSTLEIDGERAEVAEFMPMVLINPEITPSGKTIAGPEGCLSFPEIFAEISRPEMVDIKARNENWQEINFRCGGLLSRAVQHEFDHLHGILFIDRMDKQTKDELRPEFEALQQATKDDAKK